MSLMNLMNLMNTVLWALQILLALVFLGAGLLKATLPLAALEARVGGWVHDVPLPLIRTIGPLEVAGALGLVLPAALDVAPWLTWAAAAGLVPLMLGAAVVHGRRGEHGEVAFNLVLAALLVLVVVLRSGPYAF